MALHIIRDSQGRMEKILDEKEYRRSRFMNGCFGFILMAGILGYACFNSSDEQPSKAQTRVVIEGYLPEENITGHSISMGEVIEGDDWAMAEYEIEDNQSSVAEEESNIIDENELVRRFQEKQDQL